MEFLNKTEIKIFITFFLIYSFFIHWPGMNENSRFFLTRAIVDEGRFEIESFYNQTADRSYYNGHCYSDKEPGLSFFTVPLISTADSISDLSILSNVFLSIFPFLNVL